MNCVEFIELIKKAESGECESMNILHDYYCMERHIVETYIDEIIQEIKDSAEQNKSYSLFQLSMMYLLGLGLPEDTSRGIELLKKVSMQIVHKHIF